MFYTPPLLISQRVATRATEVLATVAQFERDQLIERTNAGLQRAKKEGKRLGRPPVTSSGNVQALKQQGASQSKAAAELEVSISTIKRLWNV